MSRPAREVLAALSPAPPARANGMTTAAVAWQRLVERARGKETASASHAAEIDDYRKEIDAALKGPDGWVALARFSAALGLSLFERDLLLLCATVQMNPSLLEGMPGAVKGHPTLALAILLLAESPSPDAGAGTGAWSALSPGGPLQRYHLVGVEPADFILRAPIRIDDIVLAFLLGAAVSDPRMLDLVESVPAPTFLPPTHEKVAEQIVSLWKTGERGRRPSPPVIQLASSDLTAPRAIAARASATIGVQLVMLRGADVPAAASDRCGLARLWEREHAMSESLLLLDLTSDSAESSRNALELAETLQAPLILATREPVALRRSSAVPLDVARPSAREQIEVWRHALPPGTACPSEALEPVAAHFRGGSTVANAVATALRGSLDPLAAPAEIQKALHDACRVASRRRLDSLAARGSSSVGWDDLVVPAHATKTLHEIAGQLRHRARVYETWGFGERGERGLGISALFHGDSGTGKTLAAEVIANELALDLYRVDLSRVVSKYIGETEKNLREVFDAAEESGAVLLFDEADALFGKRSEVKDSHDRYANIEVSYLLSRMETYRGLAILTTNFRQALDHAFVRRIRFMVHFPFPDAAQRSAIWSRAFPARTPTRGLNPGLLARLAVTGGSIRNIAMGAAFLAADANEPVTPAHILQAAVTEYGKLNKSLTDAETRGWL